MAHEIAHIVLGHPLIPRSAKTAEDLDTEEKEADQFAGILLMPDSIIYTCNIYSVDAVAAYLNVSKTALQMRLNNMKRLNQPYARKIPACPVCGNTEFTASSEHCNICGRSIRTGLKGIRRIFYPKDIQMGRYKRVLYCPSCYKDCSHVKGDSCRCGMSIFNLCHECDYANPGNARYCEICGKPTDYFTRGFLKPWQDALNSRKDAIIAVAEDYYEYKVND